MNIAAVILSLLIFGFETYALYDNSGLKKGKLHPDFLNYYTNLSNVAVWLYFGLLLISNWLIQPLYQWLCQPVVAMTIMLAILVTNLVYHFLLSAGIKRDYQQKGGFNPYTVVNVTLHYAAPLATLIYWLILADKTGLQYRDTLIWIIFPLLFVIYALLHGAIGHYTYSDGKHYPYEFMDIDKCGLWGALRNVVLVAIAFILLGLLAVWVSKLLV